MASELTVAFERVAGDAMCRRMDWDLAILEWWSLGWFVPFAGAM